MLEARTNGSAPSRLILLCFLGLAVVQFGFIGCTFTSSTGESAGGGDDGGGSQTTPPTTGTTSITGSVVDASNTGQTVSGASIDAYVYTPPATTAALMLRQDTGTTAEEATASTTSRGDGGYELSGLGAATYEIKVNPPLGSGYKNITIRITIPAGVSISIEILLTPSSVADSVGALTITPADAVVGLGQTQQYTATVTDTNGQPLRLTPIWITEGNVGTIAKNGLFTAGQTAGRGKIKAQVAGRTASTTVTVGDAGDSGSNSAPSIRGLQVRPGQTVRPGTKCLIGALAIDPDGDELFYGWEATDASGQPAGDVWSSFAPEVGEWRASTQEGTYTITCEVEDIWGARDTDSIEIVVSQDAPNSPPVIEDIFAFPPIAAPGGDVELECWAFDPDPEDVDLTYQWGADAGTVEPDPNHGQFARWLAPNAIGDYTITCTVSDSSGQSSQKTRRVRVGGAGFDVTIEGRSN